MTANEKKPANPLKSAWPLPVAAVMILFMWIATETIPRPQVYECLFFPPLFIHVSVIAAGLFTLRNFTGKVHSFPRWIVVCNALLFFGFLATLLTGIAVTIFSQR